MSVALTKGWVQDEPERLQGKDLGSKMTFSARPLSLHAAATFSSPLAHLACVDGEDKRATRKAAFARHIYASSGRSPEDPGKIFCINPTTPPSSPTAGSPESAPTAGWEKTSEEKGFPFPASLRNKAQTSFGHERL